MSPFEACSNFLPQDVVTTLVNELLPPTHELILPRGVPVKVAHLHDEVVSNHGDIALSIRVEDLHRRAAVDATMLASGNELRDAVLEAKIVEVVVENNRLRTPDESNQQPIRHLPCNLAFEWKVSMQ